MTLWQKATAALFVYNLLVWPLGFLAEVRSAELGGEEASTTETQDQRQYLLERIDVLPGGWVAVVQLYVDGFDELPLRQKILIYHLSEAAIAGRDMFIDQKYKHSLAIRQLIEEILTHDEGIEPKTLAEIRRYAKLFWINNGPHSAVTSRKNVLKCSFEDLAAAVERAEANGARMPKSKDASTAGLLRRFKPILFDPEFDSHATSKSPGPGPVPNRERDILQASANNFYEGVTMKDLEGFKERHPLNSKLIKRPDGRLREIVWRAGFDDVVPPGMYAKQIRAVIGHLEAAIPYATPKMARALGALIQYYRTGSPVDFRAYNIAWVA